jgi:hypothetical protein
VPRILSESWGLRPEDFLPWIEAKPFIPFSRMRNDGGVVAIPRRDLIVLMRTQFHAFRPTASHGSYDHGPARGYCLIERIEQLGYSTLGEANIIPSLPLHHRPPTFPAEPR